MRSQASPCPLTLASRLAMMGVRMVRPRTSRNQLLEIVDLLMALVTSGLESSAVMQEVVERAATLTGADGSVVELVDGDDMVYSAACGAASNALGLRLKRAASLSGLCVEQGIPLNCKDAATDPRVDRAACARVGVVSMICVPLFHRGRVVGVLKVMSGKKRAFRDSHAQTLHLLAKVIASSLSNADRFAAADHDRSHDALTGLRNRRAYNEDLADEMARARRYDRPLSLVLLDLNGFKAVNDTHGHPAGDEVLRQTAAALRRSTRNVDRCYRLGGDEFGMIFPETAQEELSAATERALEEIRSIGFDISASLGTAELDPWMTPEDLHAAADRNLYACKAAFHASLQKRA